MASGLQAKTWLQSCRSDRCSPCRGLPQLGKGGHQPGKGLAIGFIAAAHLEPYRNATVGTTNQSARVAQDGQSVIPDSEA